MKKLLEIIAVVAIISGCALAAPLNASHSPARFTDTQIIPLISQYRFAPEVDLSRDLPYLRVPMPELKITPSPCPVSVYLPDDVRVSGVSSEYTILDSQCLMTGEALSGHEPKLPLLVTGSELDKLIAASKWLADKIYDLKMNGTITSYKEVTTVKIWKVDRNCRAKSGIGYVTRASNVALFLRNGNVLRHDDLSSCPSSICSMCNGCCAPTIKPVPDWLYNSEIFRGDVEKPEPVFSPELMKWLTSPEFQAAFSGTSGNQNAMNVDSANTVPMAPPFVEKLTTHANVAEVHVFNQTAYSLNVDFNRGARILNIAPFGKQTLTLAPGTYSVKASIPFASILPSFRHDSITGDTRYTYYFFIEEH